MSLTLSDSEISHLNAILVDNLTTDFRQEDKLCQVISAHLKQRLNAFIPDGYQIHVLSVLADLHNIARQEGHPVKICPLPSNPGIDQLLSHGLVRPAGLGFVISEAGLQKLMQIKTV